MVIFRSKESISLADDVKERIMEAMVQGKATASQLQVHLRGLGSDGSDALSHELSSKILGSFTDILSELNAQYRLPKHVLSAGDKEGSDETRASSGCYRRRKSSQARTKVASTIKDDHTWRKYGQKEIHNYKFPRNYFRCSHKHDQNCKAKKQVQMMEENPSMYELTYINVHTCKDVHKATPPPPPPPPPPAQMTKDSSPLCDVQSYDALSNTNPPDVKEDMVLFSSSSSVTALAVKEEAKDMEINSLLMESEDLEEGSSMYRGFEMDFLLEDVGSNIWMFNN